MKLSVELLSEICHTIQHQSSPTIDEFKEINKKFLNITETTSIIRDKPDNYNGLNITESVICDCVEEVFEEITEKILHQFIPQDSNLCRVGVYHILKSKYGHDNILYSYAILEVLIKRFNNVLLNSDIFIKNIGIELEIVDPKDGIYTFRYNVEYQKYESVSDSDEEFVY